MAEPLVRIEPASSFTVEIHGKTYTLEAYMPDETGVILWRCALEQSTSAAMSWTFA